MSCTKAKVSKAVILQSVNNFNANRRRFIYETQEPFIWKAMDRTWWQKLLGKPARTREQAIVWCNRNLYWEDYTWCKLPSRTALVFEDLLALCGLTDQEEIELSAEHTCAVEKWSKEQ